MRILGITAWHRDPAAVLLVDGQPVAAGKEVWIRGAKGRCEFPSRAIRACLDQAGMATSDLDRVVFGSKPIREFERRLATGLQAFPRGTGAFARTMAEWLGDRLWVKNRIVKELGVDAAKIAFVEQHRALAAAAFYPSSFESAAILVLDDVAEWATTTIARGADHEVTIEHEIAYPDSIGLQHRAISKHLGFDPDTQAEFVTALAAHGEPRFKDSLHHLDACCELRVSGAACLWRGDDQRHADLAASWHEVLEARVVEFVAEARRRTELNELCVTGELAGNPGVARVLGDAIVPAACGKSSAAFGAALLAHHEATGSRTRPGPITGREATGVGGTPLEHVVSELAERLQRGERVAWVRGAIEFAEHSAAQRIVLAAAGTEGLLTALQRFEPFLQPRQLESSSDADLQRLIERTGPLQVDDFALRGGSIVQTEADAVAAFERSRLDALVVNDRLYVPADVRGT